MVVLRRRIKKPGGVEESSIVIEGSEARKLSKLKLRILETCAFDTPDFRTIRINSIKRTFRPLRCREMQRISVEFRRPEIAKFRDFQINAVSVPSQLKSEIAKFQELRISPVVVKRVQKDFETAGV
ncbi:MAG: hypothetical protein QXO16_01740 [Archaeoglobaceae archaeon]